MNGPSGFLHLNEANAWPRFTLDDLEITTAGALSLAALADGTRSRRGVFLAGPFETPGGSKAWYRLQAMADPIPDGAYVELFTSTRENGNPPWDPAGDGPFADAGWKAVPRNTLDALILNAPARQLWIGGVLRGDGRRSPAVHQMRVEYGRATWLEFLPAIYRNDDATRELLERFLSLHGSVLGALEDRIERLPTLFDPHAAPHGESPSPLAWLASWLAFDLNEAWSETDARRHLARAFELYGRRGTIEGLRRYLEIHAGVHARIEEPASHARIWPLGEEAPLGISTRLASAHAQGAVIGTTATLGQSHVGAGDDFGAALFEDVAHRFCVHVYAAELRSPGALENVHALVEREKPAHTRFHLRVVEPRMRVGVQASIGVDTIIAAGPPAMQVGMRLHGAVLATPEPHETKEDA
jgi:phage tail-like protein